MPGERNTASTALITPEAQCRTEREGYLRRSAMMQYVLTGLTHEDGFRVFAFERVGKDRVRTQFTVKADLALVRGYGIQIQDLPLLCRGLLDREEEGCVSAALTFTEEAMRVCASERAAARAAAAAKRKPPHRPAGDNLGAAWRGQGPVVRSASE
jgi:hypothetical protein